MKTNFMKQPRRSAVHSESGSPFVSGRLGLGLLLYLLLVGLMPSAAYASQCRVSLSQPTVDYGVIRRAELLGEQSGHPQFSLGHRTLRLTVDCADETPMAIRFTGVPAGTRGFRFGRDGHFILNLQQAQVDGRDVELRSLYRPDESAKGRLLPGVVLCTQAGGAPVSGRRLTALVSIDTYLPASGLAVSNETSLEGRGSVERVPCA